MASSVNNEEEEEEVKLWHETPLLQSSAFGNLHPLKVYLKLENTQESGSFKSRGIGNFCQKAVKRGTQGFLISSGGNAGMACSIACRKLSVPLDVFVPETTPTFMVELLRQQGATVHTQGRQWIEAHRAALAWREQHQEEKRELVHPYDHTDIWAGHATLVKELQSQLPPDDRPPDAVVLSVGGGGLLNGVVQGLQELGWTHTKVITMETEGADCLYRSREKGERVEIERITSVAATLGANMVSEKSWHWLKEWPILSFRCTDAEAVAACERFLGDHRMLVEPSCGAALSAVYFGVVETLVKKGELPADATVVVVVCGGAVTSLELLHSWKQTLRC